MHIQKHWNAHKSSLQACQAQPHLYNAAFSEGAGPYFSCAFLSLLTSKEFERQFFIFSCSPHLFASVKSSHCISKHGNLPTRPLNYQPHGLESLPYQHGGCFLCAAGRVPEKAPAGASSSIQNPRSTCTIISVRPRVCLSLWLDYLSVKPLSPKPAHPPERLCWELRQ